MAEELAQAKHIAVIGAGYAGMAAAVELAARQLPVTVFESSRLLGGRARAVEAHGARLDNGQHILLGAYSETLRLMQKVGADPARLLLRQPLTLTYPGHLHLTTPQLPAPLHSLFALLGAKGLNWLEKYSALRFMASLKRSNYTLHADDAVAGLLYRYRQSPRLRQYLWEPLCIAALNTRTEDASAQVFLNVLRDSLGAARQASDMLLPRVDLGTLFPDAAASYVAAHGGTIQREAAIEKISMEGGAYRLQSKQQSYGPFSHLILAVAPYHLPALIENLPELDPLRTTVTNLRYEPIVTCYLGYPSQVTLPEVMLGQAGGSMQWLFDRGQLGGPAGLLAAVISTKGPHLDLSHQELAQRIHAEIAAMLPNLPELPAPLWSQVIAEQRATFSCRPYIRRPKTTTALPRLLLAGDYIASDYPATLESAVRSGIRAATSVQG